MSATTETQPIHKAGEYQWDGIEVREYKDRPDTFLDVTRRTFFEPNHAQFQVRYFEVGPRGFTSFEQHEHEHCVVVIRGKGKVRLGNEWSDVDLHDTVYVGPNTPHQFRNDSDEPFGILCVVDRDRDRPILLDPEGRPRTSEQK